MTNGKDYNRGVRDGTTETTLDSLSRSLHELWDKYDVLPCGKLEAEMASLTTSIRWHWLLLIAMLGGYATIIGMLIKLVAQTADK